MGNISQVLSGGGCVSFFWSLLACAAFAKFLLPTVGTNVGISLHLRAISRTPRTSRDFRNLRGTGGMRTFPVFQNFPCHLYLLFFWFLRIFIGVSPNAPVATHTAAFSGTKIPLLLLCAICMRHGVAMRYGMANDVGQPRKPYLHVI